mgnify:CR=1 FL=1
MTYIKWQDDPQLSSLINALVEDMALENGYTNWVSWLHTDFDHNYDQLMELKNNILLQCGNEYI